MTLLSAASPAVGLLLREEVLLRPENEEPSPAFGLRREPRVAEPGPPLLDGSPQPPNIFAAAAAAADAGDV
eukprot:COSAG02_NODE_1681_length_11351_cov_20.077320_6_plen_71_part_00